MSNSENVKPGKARRGHSHIRAKEQELSEETARSTVQQEGLRASHRTPRTSRLSLAACPTWTDATLVTEPLSQG